MPATRDAALNRIRLRHLQCFLAVAEQRNLRRAAEALAISQPQSALLSSTNAAAAWA